MRAIVCLTFLAPLLGGCLSTAQQQSLIEDSCQVASDFYATIKSPGPKTVADFSAVKSFCSFGTSPAFASLEAALAALHADSAAGV